MLIPGLELRAWKELGSVLGFEIFGCSGLEGIAASFRTMG